jgi:hypothetical protein
MWPLHARVPLSFFFLQAMMPLRRIFDLVAGIIAGVTPSGSVPGGGVGAGDLRSVFIGGEDVGLDCFFFISVKVLFAMLEDLIVISVSFLVLLVSRFTPQE